MRPWSLLTILNFSERGPTDNGILMSQLLLVAETITGVENDFPEEHFSNIMKNIVQIVVKAGYIDFKKKRSYFP